MKSVNSESMEIYKLLLFYKVCSKDISNIVVSLVNGAAEMGVIILLRKYGS